MKIINFIGNYDKFELMLYVAKVVKLTQNASVLIIDSYETQKSRCIVPAILNDDQYITTFEEMDIAVGFKDQKDIVEYLQDHNDDFNNYDYVFIDMNSKEACVNFNSENPNVSFAVSSCDKFDILKTVGLLGEYTEKNKSFVGKMHKIYFYSLLETSDEKYIDYSFNNLDIEWNNKKIYIPLDEGDRSVLIQNQYAEKIRIRELSKTFRNSIVDIATYILGDATKSFILKTMKNIERGV